METTIKRLPMNIGTKAISEDEYNQVIGVTEEEYNQLYNEIVDMLGNSKIDSLVNLVITNPKYLRVSAMFLIERVVLNLSKGSSYISAEATLVYATLSNLIKWQSYPFLRATDALERHLVDMYEAAEKKEKGLGARILKSIFTNTVKILAIKYAMGEAQKATGKWMFLENLVSYAIDEKPQPIVVVPGDVFLKNGPKGGKEGTGGVTLN